MYKILIAGPDGMTPGTDINTNVEISELFSPYAVCSGSLDINDIECCDGVILPGGLPDLNPKHYGESNVGCGEIDDDLDRVQMAMIQRSIELHKPMFGICRGLQLMIVYHGGSLVQDICCKSSHCYDGTNGCFHRAHNIKGSFMSDLYGKYTEVNSAHHQIIKALPDSFRVSQLWCASEQDFEKYIPQAESGELRCGSDDCVIEAAYQTDYPFWGLQWHPEFKGNYRCGSFDLSKIPEFFCRMIEKNH